MNFDQEQQNVADNLMKIRKLIIFYCGNHYCDLTATAKICMKRALTTRPKNATLKQWLNDTKEVILHELSMMDRYSYDQTTDKIVYTYHR